MDISEYWNTFLKFWIFWNTIFKILNFISKKKIQDFIKTKFLKHHLNFFLFGD